MADDINDEIDLIELIEIIWNGKWLIGAFTGICASLSIVGALNLPPSFEGQIEITGLDKPQMAAYAPLNNTPGISAPIYAGSELIGYTGVLLSEDLFAAFIATLRQGTILAMAHTDLDPAFTDFEGSDAERREALSNLRRLYSFSRDKDNPNLGTLTFTTSDKLLAQAILNQSFAAMNEYIRIENLRGIANLQRSIQTSLAFEIDEVETAIDNAIANYQTITNSHLAILTEQAAIARQLGIADNQSGLANRGNNGIGINVNTDLPLYLRGFKALEKEIALIKARGTGDTLLAHVPNYPGLAGELRALKTDKRLERINEGIALTPLAEKGSFIAVNHNIETITFKSTTSKSLIVILATLMGGIIAVIFVLIRHFMALRKQAA